MARSEAARDLLVLRHAKSDRSDSGLQDHDRPLAPRGRRAAPRVGRFLTAIGALPDRIVSSSAERARRTAEMAAEAGGWECPVEIAAELYGATFEELVEVVRRQPRGARRLLLVGHEPTLSESLGRLVGGAAVRLPTAAVASARFSASSWQELGPGSGTLSWLVTPKLLARWPD